MAEDRSDEAEPAQGEGDRPRTGLRRRLGRLLNQRELAEDTREVLGGMLEMSDRAKTEAVRLVAREARNYLDELKIKEDILELITSHSLEVQLSVHLKPLADAMREDEPSPDKRAARSESPAARAERTPRPPRRRDAEPPRKAAAAAEPEELRPPRKRRDRTEAEPAPAAEATDGPATDEELGVGPEEGVDVGTPSPLNAETGEDEDGA